MKSLLLIPVFALCACFLNANPIPPPPVISELVLYQFGFSLEMALDMWGIDNLDNIRLTTSNDQANFNQGISVIYGELLVVTEEDLQSSLFIDPAGDVLIIEENYGGSWYELDKIYFGNHYNSLVSTPLEGESIVQQAFDYWGEIFYWTVKNKPPSPGSLAYQTDARGTLSGYVFDKFAQAVPGAWIKYCDEAYMWNGTSPPLPAIYSDSSGYFFSDDMFARKYPVEIIINNTTFWNADIVVELDSNNYYEFIIDSLAVGIPEPQKLPEVDISNFPNPFTNNTTFDVCIPENYHWDEAQITIMDMNGRIVDRIEYRNTGNMGSWKASWDVKTDFNTGIYIYTLGFDNKRIVSNKMIITK
ncbi:MAG: T9SS type A sorting domain-containing protein [Bacteroidota bacterium]|nr:T9SS type A sorting domain-containing protein [Bacteroidota bacterium]